MLIGAIVYIYIYTSGGLDIDFVIIPLYMQNDIPAISLKKKKLLARVVLYIYIDFPFYHFRMLESTKRSRS